jgi:hypothetical protein
MSTDALAEALWLGVFQVTRAVLVSVVPSAPDTIFAWNLRTTVPFEGKFPLTVE